MTAVESERGDRSGSGRRLIPQLCSGGGSQYGVPLPEMTNFAASGTGTRAQMLGIPGSEHLQQQPLPGATQQEQLQPLTEVASPISSRPPPRGGNFDELALAMSAGFADEEGLVAAGDAAEHGSVPGNRWPRQETLALLKIRSEMDAAFRDATLKGPLWEEVSRKLAKLGYRRSSKKCKEKFENVHKYYKRTKDGRAGRQDGKTYRFFTQLEALHSGSSTPTTVTATTTASGPTPVTASPNIQTSIGMLGSSARLQPAPLNTIPPQIGTASRVVPDSTIRTSAGVAGPSTAVSFSSDTSSSSASESEEEDTEEGRPGESRKRKRRSGGSRKMMAFFEELMKQVMERQEAMQQRFLETIEKREQDRMIREEAWKRQEMARLNREHEMMAQERAISASRDAAIITFLQKVTGQTVPVPMTVASASPPASQPPPKQQEPSPAPVSTPPPPQQPQLPQAQAPQPPPLQAQTKQHIQHQGTEIVYSQSSQMEVGPVTESPDVAGTSMPSTTDPASSRWPKTEVHALIKLRSGLDSRYQEVGPKGPLWEEIAAGMQRMGYNRSAKRCKEKWENINKYFKKVKESNKRRPDDSKTCPYFHQLDALYRNKNLGAAASQSREELETNPNPTPNLQDAAAGPLLLRAPPQPPDMDSEVKNSDGGSGKTGNGNGGNPDGNGGSTLQIKTTNGGFAPSFYREQTGGGVSVMKPGGIVKELMDRQQQQQQQRGAMAAYKGLEEPDSDMDQEDDEDDDEGNEDSKLAYRIQFQQRPSVSGTSSGGGNQSAAAAASAAEAAAGSFMALVQ